MRLIEAFANVQRPAVAFPALVQTGNTCVFASVAGAISHLTGEPLTAEGLEQDCRAMGGHTADFAPALRADHDRNNPLPAPEDIGASLQNGSVLILSLETARFDGVQAERTQRYHMLSLFNLANGFVQVWDTNGRGGFISREHFAELTHGHDIALPYETARGNALIAHDQHHCVLLSRR
jgi:hypothetical protein